MVDVEILLAPVNADSPCGERLEYDAEYVRLDELARGRPELQMGSSIRAAEPPDWRRVAESAVALLERTKDLHVLILLSRARLRVEGLVGFCETLGVLRAILERYWETVHPQLDRDDGNDSSERLNVLGDLADPDGVLTAVRDAEVASARGLGRVSVRDLERAASGTRTVKVEDAATPEGQPPAPAPPPVDAVFAAADPAALATTGRAVAAAVVDLEAMDRLVAEKTDGQRIPNLSRLTSLLQLVARPLTARTAQEATVAPPDLARADGAAPGTEAVPSPPFTGTIRSRNDVLGALDSICAYYERFEPSSPIPLLLKRSRRLVAASFLDIVRDLVPDAVAHVEALRGKQE